MSNFDNYFRYARSARMNAGTGGGASTRRDENDISISDMRYQLGRHAMILKSLMLACERKGVFTDEEFKQILEEVDMLDGQRNGQYVQQSQPTECSSCGKVNTRNAVNCMYCGALFEYDDVL